jgi:glycosyltransferase involved in cell wall biosynthesis
MDEPSASGEPEVSVIVPVHNNAGTISEQLDALARNLTSAPPTELLVVDNRSSDGSAEIVRCWSDRTGVPVRIIPATERAGEPYARNVGWRAARASHVVYCDGDDVVGDEWIRAMHEGLKRWPRVTGPVDPDRLNDPVLARVRGRTIFCGLPKLYDTIAYAHGCNMGFRRDVLIDLDGFDERFFAGCDQAIAVAAWQRRHELGWIPEAVVHYRLRNSPRAMWRQGESYGRYRVKVRALTPDLVDRAALRRATARRLGWAFLHAPGALTSSERRLRWLWVASQFVGEARGSWEERRGD